MEIAGLMLAVGATALIAYAVPTWVDRRHAIVTSREGDRFSESLTLIDPSYRYELPVEEPSSRPLLARSAGTDSTGNQMSDANSVSRPRPARDPRDQVRRINMTPDRVGAREYAALKARRASRVSIERAAAKRRLVTAGSGAALSVVFVALAAFGVMAWPWVALPLAFVVGTIAASIVAGEKAQKTAAAQDARLAELRKELNLTDTVEKKRSKVSKPSQKKTTGVSVAASKKQTSPVVGAASVKTTSSEESFQTDLSSGSDIVREASSSAVEPPQERIEESSPVQAERPVSRVSGGEWDYVPMPAALHTKRPVVRGRAVHTHTDIRGVRRVEREAAVPGRPVRASQGVAAVESVETSARPTFRFDLDAVLDQRRAQ